uniref:WXG100 family type VII secretion target n=1 Tax=Eubacterium cellulosolvens (strain ATCC 43171 / JCM 9499 / 6) TaxID=633697 RepID=I5AXE8_EUBC6
MSRFQVDADEVISAKKAMEEKLEQFSRAMKRMKLSVDELDEVWEGPNHDSFRKSFSGRFESMKSYEKMMKTYIDHLGDAGKTYRKCEEDVKSLC